MKVIGCTRMYDRLQLLSPYQLLGTYIILVFNHSLLRHVY